MFDMGGKTVLVTGASTGLGRHFAHTVAAAGAASVVLMARREARLAEVATELADRGTHAVVVAADVSDHSSVTDAITRARQHVAAVDVLVNNAGGGETSPALDLEPREWTTTLNSNLDGTWFMSQAIARWARERRQGLSIVNITSVLGLRVMPQTTAYASAKAGVVQLTRQLALEWAKYGIRVNAIAPGYFPTEAAPFKDPQVREAMLRRVPFRRFGALAELDGPLLLLASDAGSYISGTVLSVDGAVAVNSV